MAGVHPIWRILRHRGLPWSWLARRTGYSPVRVRTYACGMAEPTAEFREKAAYALDLPEWVLFSTDDRAPSQEALRRRTRRSAARARAAS
jgi:transcriptional regulator with XRE-family HTH domain